MVARRRPDATTFLTALLVLLYAIPSDLRLVGLGGAGAPSGLWALGAALIWCLFRLQEQGSRRTDGPRILRGCVWVLLGATMASWVAAMMRPLPPFESNLADLGLLRMAAFCGLLLLVADGITDRERLLVMLRRFSWAAALLGLLGLVQFVTGLTFVESISLPGLRATQDFAAVAQRGDFTRSAGTAMSPLEYAFALSLAFPVALTLALFDESRTRLRRSLPAILLGAALLVSVSRSGIIGLALVLVVLFPTWPRQVRGRMLRVAGVALVGVFVLVPGLAGTMRYLFTSTGSDPSAQSRSGSAEVVGRFLSDVPVLGRGFGTFLPQYRILDNQYLGLLIEIGALGLIAFVAVQFAAALGAFAAARRTADVLSAQLGYALVAALTAGFVLTALFDVFAFPMAIGTLSLVLGLAGAYCRLESRAAEPRRPWWSTVESETAGREPRPLLVYSAGIEWHGVKGTDRHLAERLAERVDVLWVDPPVSVLRTLTRRPGEGSRLGRSVTTVAPGIQRLSVVAPPLPSRRFVRAISRWRLRRSIRWAVRSTGRAPWAFVSSRPEPVLDALPEAVTVYLATDDYIAGAELMGLSISRMRWAEREQLRVADVLVAVSAQISSRWEAQGRTALILPNGCDTAVFARVDDVEPVRLDIPVPAAGVVGQISARIDLELLEAVVARELPLLIVGPVDAHFEPERWAALVGSPQVQWVGSQPFDRLPGYLACMGVGLTPYADTVFNRASFPLKTLEYLAAGRTVVSTPLPAVTSLGTDLILTANGPADFAEAVAQQLGADPTGDSARCRAFARAHDWSVRADGLLRAVECFHASRTAQAPEPEPEPEPESLTPAGS